MVRVLQHLFPKGYYKGQKDDGFAIDGGLLKAIEFLKTKTNKSNLLSVIAVVGYPGTGKSTLFTQCAAIIDHNFNLDNCHFTVDDFATAVTNKPLGAPINVEADDEAVDLSSKSAMSATNKKIQILLARMRSKKIIVFLMLPSFFDLDRNIAMFYCDMVIRCKTRRQIEKGYFEAWLGHEAIKELYLKGKKNYSYSYPKPNISGKFIPCFCLPAEKYEEKKQDTLRKMFSTTTRTDNKYIAQRNNLIMYMYNNFTRTNSGQKVTGKLISEVVTALSDDEVYAIINGKR